MGSIISFLKTFDIAKLLPNMGTFLTGIEVWMVVLMMVGPLLMLGLGLLYYYKPPKEANFSWGFRTYFSMGSVEVWQFTQALAGKIWTLLGAALSVVVLVLSILLCVTCSARGVTIGAVWIVSIELALVVASWVWINSIVLKFYDKEGTRRPGVVPPTIKLGFKKS